MQGPAIGTATRGALRSDEAALPSCQGVETSCEDFLVRCARLARSLLNASDAAVHIIDRDWQWRLPHGGSELQGSLLSDTASSTAVAWPVWMAVTDIALDARFAGSPLALQQPPVRFFASAPLRTPLGEKVGVLEVMDRVPRQMSEAQRQGLAALADTTMMALSLFETLRMMGQRARTDPLTGLPNRAYLRETLHAIIAAMSRHGRAFSVIYIDCDHFKQINDTLGHAMGDRLLCQLASWFRRSLRASDAIGRLGGDEFVVVLAETGATGARHVASRLLRTYRDMMRAQGLATSLSLGVATFLVCPQSIDAALAAADQAMYAAKKAGGDRFVAVTLRCDGEPAMPEPHSDKAALNSAWPSQTAQGLSEA